MKYREITKIQETGVAIAYGTSDSTKSWYNVGPFQDGNGRVGRLIMFK